MKIYLASRYPRRFELQEHAKVLEAAGHEITSRWIYGGEEGLTYRDIALLDLEDIDRADCVLSFTELGSPPHVRGGRHVEFGYGLAKGKICATIGEWENVFHYHPKVAVFDTVEDFIVGNVSSRRDKLTDKPGGSLDKEGLKAHSV